jgi:Rrf2 family nitric oxide-sensitive transcriptional repressor
MAAHDGAATDIMQLTLHTDYAFRALLYLATQPAGQLVSTEQISSSYGISRHHLVRVIQTLSAAGYVQVSAGRAGGVALAREARAIRLGDVMRATEANLRVVECFDAATNTCPIMPVCSLRPVLEEALRAFLSVLDRYTLADLVEGRSRNRLAKILSG